MFKRSNFRLLSPNSTTRRVRIGSFYDPVTVIIIIIIIISIRLGVRNSDRPVWLCARPPSLSSVNEFGDSNWSSLAAVKITLCSLSFRFFARMSSNDGNYTPLTKIIIIVNTANRSTLFYLHFPIELLPPAFGGRFRANWNPLQTRVYRTCLCPTNILRR